MMNNQYLFTFLAPPKRSNSAGINAVWDLYEAFKHAGQAVLMLVINESTGELTAYEPEPKLRIFSNDNIVAIYPDTIIGNPINAKHVVRYQLNRFGALGGSMPEEGDFILSHSRIFGKADFVLYNANSFTEALDYRTYNRINQHALMSAYYVGKGNVENVNNLLKPHYCLEITKDFPRTRRQLYVLLAESVNNFYCFDNLTSLALEAKILGCNVEFVGCEENQDSEILTSWRTYEIIDIATQYIKSYQSRVNQLIETLLPWIAARNMNPSQLPGV